MTDPDIEWLDDEDTAAARADEELAAGARRPPLRRRTRIALGVLAAAVLGTAVTVGIVTGSPSRPRAAPTTRTVAPTRSTFPLPQRPPASALAAIRVAFPKAELTSFLVVSGTGTAQNFFRSYNVTQGLRRIEVSVGPLRKGEADAVFRTATSLEIAQALGRSSRVQVQLRVSKGAPTAADFAAIQQLVQDTRLLAVK